MTLSVWGSERENSHCECLGMLRERSRAARARFSRRRRWRFPLSLPAQDALPCTPEPRDVPQNWGAVGWAPPGSCRAAEPALPAAQTATASNSQEGAFLHLPGKMLSSISQEDVFLHPPRRFFPPSPEEVLSSISSGRCVPSCFCNGDASLTSHKNAFPAPPMKILPPTSHGDASLHLPHLP